MEYLFFVVCLTAAVTDLLRRQIPNLWLGSWFLTGLLLAGLAAAPETASLAEGVLQYPWSWQAGIGYLGRALLVYLILIPAWRLRMMGAGDVKLCGVMAAFLGLRVFVRCMVYSLFVGSILSLFCLIAAKSLRRRIGIFLAWFRQCISCGTWIPYRKERDMDGTIPFAPIMLIGYVLGQMLS